MRDCSKSDRLLDWYGKHARDLPWRIAPALGQQGVRPDPYHVWLSEIMLQQTTVATVLSYFEKFVTDWPTVGDLAAAPADDVMAAWAGLGYYARARNLIKCANIISNELSGVFPQTREALLELPGIGEYTAAAIASIAFDKSETVVDGNVIRVISRLFAIEQPTPKSKSQVYELAASLTPSQSAGDYAQAVMDLGAGVCTPNSPNCSVCPWQSECQAFELGRPEDYPKKQPKILKPTRFGIAYLVKQSPDAWLLERRPPKGLLGGMLGWPGSEWGSSPVETPPIDTQWFTPDQSVKHTFTHFHLELSLRLAIVDRNQYPRSGRFISGNEFSPSHLPTVMRKAYVLAQACEIFQNPANPEGQN